MEKESEGESNRKEDRRKGREREVEHGGTLQGVTFGANSVPSGCLHQFYRRFLNPDVGTDFTRSRLSLHRVEYLWHMSRGTVGQEMNKCGGCCFWIEGICGSIRASIIIFLRYYFVNFSRMKGISYAWICKNRCNGAGDLRVIKVSY